jgi:hypothetical protein
VTSPTSATRNRDASASWWRRRAGGWGPSASRSATAAAAPARYRATRRRARAARRATAVSIRAVPRASVATRARAEWPSRGSAAASAAGRVRRFERGMTERERLSREALLRRAAALAGAVYVAPVLTSSAGAEVERPRRCKVGRRCVRSRDCRNRKQQPCVCCPEGTHKAFTCQRSPGHCGVCGPDIRCTQERPPCDVVHYCNAQQTCICYVLAPSGQGLGVECVSDPSTRFCLDYPRCDKATGEGCPAGSCCLDTCCPDGICDPPCSGGPAAPRISRGSGSGPRPFLQ